MAEAAGSTDESGISRCGISGLYDAKGNPAALASGWLQVKDEQTGRTRHRYYVLCPTYLAFFSSEEHAGISEDGFMAGNADAGIMPSFGSGGAHIALSNVYSCAPDAMGEPTFEIVLKEAAADGTNAVTLVCANKDIADGWAAAINGQVAVWTAVPVPPRAKPAPVTVEEVVNGATKKAALAVQSSMRNIAAETKKGGLSGLMSSLLGGKSDSPARMDDEYVTYAPWEDRGIDLQSPEGKSCLSDEMDHPAAILHGWLTKKNKSGLRAGSVEKDRYFVLTPVGLSFFPDEKTAAVKDGYMYGKTEGEKIGHTFGGLREPTGAMLALEAVCEVKMISKVGDSNAVKRMSTGSSRSNRSADSDQEDDDGAASPRHKGKSKGSKARKQRKDEDSDDGSDDSNNSDSERIKRAAAKQKGKGRIASRDAAGEPTAGSGGHVKPSGPPPSTLIELDFGDFSLIVNAHNAKNRNTWVHGMRKWAGWRKRQVDELMFANLGNL